MSLMQSPSLASNIEVKVGAEESVDQLNLVPVELKAPVYKQRRFVQSSGGTSMTLSGSTTLSQFWIPASCWNLSKGFITMDCLWAVGANPSINTVFTDCLPIDSIQLATASGQVLANIQNCQVYTKVSQAVSTNMDDYLTRAPVYGDTAMGTAFPISQITGLNPAGLQLNAAAVLNRVTAQLALSRPTDASIIDVVAGGDVADVASATPSNQASGSDVNVRGAPQSLISGALEAGGNESLLTVRYKIPLKAILGTILAMDKTLYFGQNLQLQIYWKPLANWGFNCVGIAAGASIALVNTSLTNYFLYLYEDINTENTSKLRAAVNSGGIQMLVPYTNSSQLATAAAAGTYRISTPLTSGTGICLKRCITIPVNAANTTKRTANTFNVASVKWSSVQSFLDSIPLQDQPLLMSDSTAFNYMYDLIKNSPAGISSRTWEQNCFFMDNFSDCQDSSNFLENDTKKSGLDIRSSRTYDVQFVQASTGGLTLAQYQTWIRVLVVSPMGISWGSNM